MRFEIATRGLEATLRKLADCGFATIELVSFPGCRGNPFGDFGSSTDLDPASIGAVVRGAALSCPSMHATLGELSPSNMDATLQRASLMGTHTVVLSSLPLATPEQRSQQRARFQELNALGAGLKQRGFKLVLHMQAELWRPLDGVRAADELPAILDPALCRLEFDPSGAIAHRIDPAGYVAAHPGRFFAMHLRDGLPPIDPNSYLPALPLGEGSVDWGALLNAAIGSGVEHYFVEMEVLRPAETFDAIYTSLQFLQHQGHWTPPGCG